MPRTSKLMIEVGDRMETLPVMRQPSLSGQAALPRYGGKPAADPAPSAYRPPAKASALVPTPHGTDVPRREQG